MKIDVVDLIGSLARTAHDNVCIVLDVVDNSVYDDDVQFMCLSHKGICYFLSHELHVLCLKQSFSS